ncbi:bifunctional 4-hydroxy-2-oxoglutarate aldolase/2-dehydro-3-deoxy-phosphogluconate aldolase [Prauserella rugosa]|uniref:2-dehydro-3-deoxyphosphogluconate aldolase/(4S)-4-hydroxy-2-oxoglutarate aldolase n=1 Tax=Prauserella rugosa TaxID=43354 RepID=A0A660C9U4_9PSEU|nr:bifunctional 4-hydroxy-2-oxoglutarate aldolase/2-dehydro-3-deoxy-phosphogluconate aldolase [Prauserella rugosa]KMS87724.1 2-dehydro-3-deoxyphosphogluconate aldolase [Streptomyces regensis]TWH20390.1 2-dehydro-3-deoxyphosphogluconate aldolase/(4S)-4-hydroxy-2-oxoglutarate aldolase [Prauserella rugosa]
MGQRQRLPERTAANRLVVVVRAARAEDYPPVLDTMVEAGVRSVELTLTTPGTFEALPGLLERYGDTADIGVGTVTRPDEVDAAADRRAHYLVTPVSDPAVVDRALERGIPIVPGGLTPTELGSTWVRGVPAVKVFPAGQVGPGYLKDLRGPFPDLQAIPSGGVDLESARAWLAAGAAAISVGGPLLGDALRGGDRAALAERTRRFVEVCVEGGAA